MEKDTHSDEKKEEGGGITERKRNHYETLGVDKMASPKVIEKAYRKLARITHPDKEKSKKRKKTETYQQCTFDEIREAKECLLDADSRIEYNMRIFGLPMDGWVDSERNDFDQLFASDYGDTRREEYVEKPKPIVISMTVPLHQWMYQNKEMCSGGIDVLDNRLRSIQVIPYNELIYQELRRVKSKELVTNKVILYTRTELCRLCSGYGWYIPYSYVDGGVLTFSKRFHDNPDNPEKNRDHLGTCLWAECLRPCVQCTGSGHVLEDTSEQTFRNLAFKDRQLPSGMSGFYSKMPGRAAPSVARMVRCSACMGKKYTVRKEYENDVVPCKSCADGGDVKGEKNVKSLGLVRRKMMICNSIMPMHIDAETRTGLVIFSEQGNQLAPNNVAGDIHISFTIEDFSDVPIGIRPFLGHYRYNPLEGREFRNIVQEIIGTGEELNPVLPYANEAWEEDEEEECLHSSSSSSSRCDSEEDGYSSDGHLIIYDNNTSKRILKTSKYFPFKVTESFVPKHDLHHLREPSRKVEEIGRNDLSRMQGDLKNEYTCIIRSDKPLGVTSGYVPNIIRIGNTCIQPYESEKNKDVSNFRMNVYLSLRDAVCGFNLWFPDLDRDYTKGIYNEEYTSSTDGEEEQEEEDYYEYNPEHISMDTIGADTTGEYGMVKGETKDLLLFHPSDAYRKIGYSINRHRVTWTGDTWTLKDQGPPCCIFCGGNPFVYPYKEASKGKRGKDNYGKKRIRDEDKERAFADEFSRYTEGKSRGYLGYNNLPEEGTCTIISKDLSTVICEANPKTYASVLCNTWTNDTAYSESSTTRGHCGDINVFFRVMAPIRSNWDDQTLIMFDYCCNRFGSNDVNRARECTDLVTNASIKGKEIEK